MRENNTETETSTEMEAVDKFNQRQGLLGLIVLRVLYCTCREAFIFKKFKSRIRTPAKWRSAL